MDHEQCGTTCELDEEEIAEAAVEQAMAEVLAAATTEQLRDALRALGWRVVLESEDP
jgi:hypothetical protein